MNSISPALLNKLTQCLCPPGNDVFTVNTAKERKEALHQHIFGTTVGINKLWSESLNDLPNSTNAVVLSIASDCGYFKRSKLGTIFIRSTLLGLDIH